MTLLEESAVLPATRFRYRVAAGADKCSAAPGLLSDSDAGASLRRRCCTLLLNTDHDEGIHVLES